MLRDAFEEIEGIVDDLEDKIVDLENDLEDKNKEIGSLTEENERLKLRLEYLESQIEEYERTN